MKYASTQSEKKRLDIPGCNNLKKIYTFIDAHFITWEMFLEYLKGSCVNTKETLCDYCSLNEKCCPGIDHVPRPFPDYESTGLHYLRMKKTAMANMITDDFHPRVQLKKAYVLGECTLDNPNKTLEFSKKFVVSEECIRGNLEHLKLVDLKKDKRKKERAEKDLPRQGRNMKILIGLPCSKIDQRDNSCFGQIPETPQHRLPAKEESKTQRSTKAHNQPFGCNTKPKGARQ